VTEGSSLTTQFAPAERAAPETVRDQSEYFRSVPLLADIFNAVPSILVILNRQRQIVFANQALLGLPGASEENVYGRRPGEVLHCVHAAENEAGCGTTEFCRTCGAVKAILSSLHGEKSVKECRIIQQDGSALDLEVSASPLTVNGELFTIFAVRDISHEKRRQALERIFFHDILNTAGVVLGFADLIKNAELSGDRDIREQLHRAALRLASEINAQREIRAAENNELVVHPTMLNTLTLLKEIKEFYQHHEAGRDRRIEIAPDAQSVSFVSDGVLLGRVIGNMVKNALEATPPGQKVTLSCQREGEQVSFSVHNPGFMPRPVQLQLFQRSFSTKGTGRGLGTYSMKLLSERYLKGSITFETSPEEGTTFRAVFPLSLMEGADRTAAG
jgi:PAS domain S-box-containing protein